MAFGRSLPRRFTILLRFVRVAAILHLALLPGCAGPGPGSGPWPETRPEATGYRATSTHADVVAFLEAVAARAPEVSIASIGRSTEGRDLVLVLASDPPIRSLEAAARDPRPKVLITANIHAGEVEAKEAVQLIVREIGQGRHDDLLRDLVLLFLPDYNPDGNDAITPRQRPDQAGPAEGVGRRTTAGGLDLNRDFVKAEAVETQALLRLLDLVDPVLVLDGHTTDGSFHGFDVTYAGPLSPATDEGLLRYERAEFLPELRRRLAQAGVPTYDYGNWEGEWRPPASRDRWETFDHLARYHTNYVGLRNRLSLLSEAYSHAPFARRIASTRAFILEALALVARDRDRIAQVLHEADCRAAELWTGAALPTDARYAFTEDAAIPAGIVDVHREPGTKAAWLEDTGVHTWLRTSAYVHFDGTNPLPVPHAWAIPDPPPEIVALLRRHGLRLRVLDAPLPAAVEAFVVSGLRIERGRFQGHSLREVVGVFQARDMILPAGTLVVGADQRLARLAFILLEARSADGLATWDLLRPVPDGPAEFRHPVLRVRSSLPGPGP